MRSLFVLFISIISTIGLIGCENCGPSAEPFLTLNLQQQAAVPVDTLFALDTPNPLPKQPYPANRITTNGQLVVPLNLHADSSRYVFQISGHRDTLTVYYKRTYAYRDKKCGYVLDLYPPAGTQARTTIGTVAGVWYLQNSDRTYPGGPQDTGIQLSLRL